ncbi:hypothetical protein EMGBS11_00290 [Actinomycetota bacterium]|nr:hypothetical protein EMGBS11_00290 [Actinomycetota bacterium]
MTKSEKFRPGSAIASGWVLIAFFVGFILQSLFYGGDILMTIGICGAGAFGAYLLFLKPYVLLFDEGIKIVNPTKEITATWDLVEEIETRYSMSIQINDRTYYAWAAPAPSGRHSRRMNKTDLLPGADIPRRVGDSLQSDSGVCAYMANIRRKNFTGVSASEFEIINDNTSLYIFAALVCIGIAAAVI